jgi:hypothetical protein
LGINYRKRLIDKFGIDWWKANHRPPGRPRIPPEEKLARLYQGLEPAERDRFLELIGAIPRPDTAPPSVIQTGKANRR